MKKTIRVAEKNVQVESVNEAYFLNRFNEYISASEEGETDIKITSRKTDAISFPQGEIVYLQNDRCFVSGDDGTFFRCYFSEDDKGEKVPYCLIADDRWNRSITMTMTDLCAKHRHMTEPQVEYIFQSNAFARSYIASGNLVIHGSAISYKEEGILFSANSGVGKSTHTGEWKRMFPEEVEIINDDKPAFGFEAGEIYMYGTPWSGKTPLNKNKKVRPKAIVMIERGSKNEIRRMEMVEAVCALIPQIHCPRYHTELIENAIEKLKILLANIPVYKLRCTVGSEAVEAVYRELFEKDF